MDGTDTSLDLSTGQSFSTNTYYEHNTSGYKLRLEKAASMVDTPYTMLMADDDFYSCKAIDACLEELEINNDLIACCGRVVNFKFNDTFKKIVGFDEFKNMADHSISQNSAVDRMVYHMRNYAPTLYYSVMRTDYWMKSMQSFIIKEFSLLASNEYQFEISACYLGKSKVIPHLLWYRSWEDVSIRGTDAAFNLENPMDLWWKNPHSVDERSEFLNVMANTLSQYTQDSVEDVKIWVSKAMDGFCAFGENYFHRPSKLYKIIRKIYLELIPESLVRIVNDLRFSQIDLLEKIKELEKQDVKVDWDEAADIYTAIELFHSKHP